MFVASLLASIASIVGWSSDPVTHDTSPTCSSPCIQRAEHVFGVAYLGYKKIPAIHRQFLVTDTDPTALPFAVMGSSDTRAICISAGRDRVAAMTISGTDSLPQWRINIGTITSQHHDYNAIAVHAALVLLEQWVVVHAFALKGAKVLYVTGHSQGGGLAEIVARVLVALKTDKVGDVDRLYNIANQTKKPLLGAKYLFRTSFADVERIVLVAISAPQWLPANESAYIKSHSSVASVFTGQKGDPVMYCTARPLVCRAPHSTTQFVTGSGYNPHCLDSMKQRANAHKIRWSMSPKHEKLTIGFLANMNMLLPRLPDTC